jgi:hypothetical protein
VLALVAAGKRIATGDLTRSVVVFAAGTLAPEHGEWGTAMVVEFDQLPAGANRKEFGLGCVWAVVRIHLRHPLGRREPGGSLRTVIAVAIAVSVVLVGYGLTRYPGLRSDDHTWGVGAVCGATLAGYGIVAATLSRAGGTAARTARWFGLATGLAVGGSWFVLLTSAAITPAWSFLPMAVAVLAPSIVATVVARTSRSSAAGARAALWAGLVGGLTVFIGYSIAIFINQGHPYDRALIDEFHRSGATNLTTYAVGDALGEAVVMLVVVPVIALALGSLCALAAGRRAA